MSDSHQITVLFCGRSVVGQGYFTEDCWPWSDMDRQIIASHPPEAGHLHKIRTLERGGHAYFNHVRHTCQIVGGQYVEPWLVLKAVRK